MRAQCSQARLLTGGILLVAHRQHRADATRLRLGIGRRGKKGMLEHSLV